jgi:CRISPR-associated protein Csx17
VDDGSPELRLALALAAARSADGGPDVRGHFLPLDPKTRGFRTRENGLAQDLRVVCHGRRAEDDLIAIVQRRLLEGAATRTLPLWATGGTAATARDLGLVLAGVVDLDRTLWLARGLAAVRWPDVLDHHLPSPAPAERSDLDPAYLALRLAHLPFRLPRGAEGVAIPVDPEPLRLLAAGDGARALQLVLRRLRASSVLAPLSVAALDPGHARRYAASLAFPITRRSARGFARLLDPATFEEDTP